VRGRGGKEGGREGGKEEGRVGARKGRKEGERYNLPNISSLGPGWLAVKNMLALQYRRAL
jgi:hypothetical protein